MRRQNYSSSYSPNSGSVLFAQPPNWVDRAHYHHPVLYAYPQCFSPLAQASVRGMKETVKSILENSRKMARKRIKNKKKHHHHSGIAIGDHSNEEFNIIVDNGYSKETPSKISITPLQIASSEYIGTQLQKYLVIVELLVSYGSNIHAASFYVTEPDPISFDQLNEINNQYRATQIVLQKCQQKVRLLENKGYNQFSDQNERLNDVKLSSNLNKQINRLFSRGQQLKNQKIILEDLCKTKKMVNDSPYVMALKMRKHCNDTSLIEAMVKGSIVIKESIVKAKGVGNVLTD
eukprot:50422_1